MATSEDSRYRRQWHILPMTSLSVDYRFADLLRLIIADKIHSSEPSQRQHSLDLLFSNISKNQQDITNLKKEYRSACSSVEEKHRLVVIKNLDRPSVVELCKNDDDRYESLIEDEDSHGIEEFRRLCDNDVYFEELRDRLVKRRQWNLKHSKTNILVKIMQSRKINVSQLIEIIKGEGEHFSKKRKIMPLISLNFEEKASNLIDKIIGQFEAKQHVQGNKFLDARYDQFTGLDYIPQPALTQAERNDKENPYKWLDEIRIYRNGLTHPSTDEIMLEKLYEKDEHIISLCHPYVKFLRFVNFTKYFPPKLLEKEVQDFLYPLATVAEIELVLNNYTKLLDKLDDRRQRIENLLAQITSLKESKDTLTEEVTELQKRNDTLSKIEKDREELIDDYNRLREKHRSKGAEILQILEDMKPDQPESVRNCKEKLTMVAEGMMDVDEAQQADDGDDQPA